MKKENDKIIIFKDEDRELYSLVEKIESTDFGIITFDSQEIKEIKTRCGKPYQIITIERSRLLSE